jgi:flagellar secretion chaperone FliS
MQGPVAQQLPAFASQPIPALPGRGAQAYIQTQVSSRSPLELVVMLYEGLIRFCGEGRAAIDRRDLVGKRAAMSRALAILSELQSTLNMAEGGELAISLDNLYSYINGRLLEASMQNDAGPLDETVKLLSSLRDAWSEIASREHADGAGVGTSARP